MGFLDWLFGRKKVEKITEQKEEPDPESSKELVKKKIEEENASFQPRIDKFFSELKERSIRLEESLENLRKANPPEKVDEQALKVAMTSRESFISKMSAISNAIKRGFSKDIESFSDYYAALGSTINQANQETVKEFMSLDVVFNKETHKAIDRMKEIKDHADGLKDELDKKRRKVNSLEKILNDIRSVEEKSSDKSETEKEIEKIKEEVEKSERDRINAVKESEDLGRSETWKSYIQLTKDKEAAERETRQIIEEVVNIFASLNRVLKKFVQLIESGALNFKNQGLLKMYIESPFDAFVQDSNMEVINSAFVSMEEMMKNKKLIIDDEGESLKIINELNSSKILQKLSQKNSESKQKLESLKGQIDNHEFLKKKKELQDSISKLTRDIEENKKQLMHQEKSQKDLKAEIQIMKENLKNKLKEI